MVAESGHRIHVQIHVPDSCSRFTKSLHDSYLSIPNATVVLFGVIPEQQPHSQTMPSFLL